MPAAAPAGAPLVINDQGVFAVATVVQINLYLFVRTLLAMRADKARKAAVGDENAIAKATRAERRARSWVLSLFTSALLTAIGAHFIWKAAPAMLAADWEAFRGLALADTGRMGLMWFVATMCLDMTLGVAEYKEQIQLGSGWCVARDKQSLPRQRPARWRRRS